MAPSTSQGAWFIVDQAPTNNGHLGLDPVLESTVEHLTGNAYKQAIAEGNKPYLTRAAAEAVLKPLYKASQAGHIPDPLSGVDAIGDFFSRLTEANTWIRVGEFAGGALLLHVGLQGLVPS